jgi:hypothetical protein
VIFDDAGVLNYSTMPFYVIAIIAAGLILAVIICRSISGEETGYIDENFNC